MLTGRGDSSGTTKIHDDVVAAGTGRGTSSTMVYAEDVIDRMMRSTERCIGWVTGVLAYRRQRPAAWGSIYGS